MKSKIIISLIAMFLFILPFVQAEVEYGVNWEVKLQPLSQEVIHGETAQVEISVINKNSYCELTFYYAFEGGTYNQFISLSGSGNPSWSNPKILTIGTPSEGEGTNNYKIYIKAKETGSYLYCGESQEDVKSEFITIKYKASAEEKAATSAKSAASSSINSANSAINSAQNKINEASKIGADISSATQQLNSAKSDYSSSTSLLSSGDSAFNSKVWTSATSYYNQAQTKASSAQSSATQAFSTVDKIVEEYNKKKTQSDSAKTAASNAVSSANTAINTAKSRINEASKLGADISSATQYLNSAEADLTGANGLVTSGNSAYSSKDFDSATSYYNQAQTKASSAQSSAAQAKSGVDRIVEEYNKKKTEGQNVVSDANSAIDTAKQRIDAGDKVIKDATIIGLDTAQAKADIATARSKIDTAEDYYKEASNMFSTGNFESAKSKSQSAIDLARQAENLATTAYSKLNERLTVSGESAKSILNANSEVSQMNEILTKLEVIVRGTRKFNIDLSKIIPVVDNSKSGVNSAEDLLSQAKNRQASGSFDNAVTSANEARDKAASARNRLDTITQEISFSSQDALEKAYSDLEAKIKNAELEVTEAQATYGATPEKVIAAQNDLSNAKSLLSQAKQQIESVKVAGGLMPLIDKSSAAFTSIESANEKVLSALNNAGSAKIGLTKKIATGAAIAAAAGGGGFLYYRYRKKKGGKGKEKHEENKPSLLERLKQKTKNVEESLKCPKCKSVIKGTGKFCNACGHKLPKVKKEVKKAVYEMLNVCSKCEEVLREGAKFCNLCGGKAKNKRVKKE